MTRKNPTNVAASVRQRLTNKARQEKRPFAELLQYYAMERFLYRLSCSKYKAKFILKGALMLRAWDAPEARPTKDIDLLGNYDNQLEIITDVIQDICQIESNHDDGMTFDTNSIQGINIKEDADYTGVRVNFTALLGVARVNMQIDIGFGDNIFPEPEIMLYPTLLDHPEPSLFTYSRETTIAEKFEAMIKLGILNSRMKDFYDIWLLARQFEFNGEVLQKAIIGTFQTRGTELTNDIAAFTISFAEEKSVQWKAFRNKLTEETIPEDLREITHYLEIFIRPILEAMIKKQKFTQSWKPGTGWR